MRILNAHPSQGAENDWNSADALTKAAPPASINLTDDLSWWRRAEDQRQTGSCVGHAVGAVLWRHAVLSGMAKNYGRSHKPSYRYIWEASKEMDQWTYYPTTMLEWGGTYIKTALDVLRKHGTVPDRVYPMHRESRVTMQEGPFNALASKLKIKAYFAVRPEGKEGPAFGTYQEWLAQQGPIVTRLTTDSSFRNARRRTAHLRHYDKGSAHGGHAVVVCGYDGDGNYLVKNSWGSRWGDRGYVWVSPEYAREAFTESYGITV